MEKSVKTNVLFNLFYQLLAIILPLITMPYVSRVLGVSNIGINSYTLSIVSYFTLFSAFGLNDYAQREIAKCQDDKKKISTIFREMVANRFITTFVVLVVYILFSIFVFEEKYRIYYMILVLNILSVMFEISWFFQGVEDFKSLALKGSLIKILSTIFIFIFVKSSDDLWIYILINSLCLFLSSIIIWVLVPKKISKAKISFINVFKHYKGSLVYFIPAIAIQIYTILDKSMIQWITNSNYENGIYESAEKISKVALTVIQVANNVMKSRMAYLFYEGKAEEGKELIKKSFSIISLLVYPMCAGIILVAPNLIPLYLGDGYESSIQLLQIFSSLIVFIGVSGFLSSSYFMPVGKQGLSNLCLIFGALFNFVLNLVLIPILNSTGAAIASIASECVITVLYIFFSRKFIDPFFYIKVGYKHILSSIFMLVIVFLSTNWLQINNIYLLIIKVAEGILVYFTLLFFFNDGTFKKIYETIYLKYKSRKKDN